MDIRRDIDVDVDTDTDREYIQTQTWKRTSSTKNYLNGKILVVLKKRYLDILWNISKII
jgi:hypothetical protein